MCTLLRKITYGEFSEFVQEKKVYITYMLNKLSKYSLCIIKGFFVNIKLGMQFVKVMVMKNRNMFTYFYKKYLWFSQSRSCS